VPTPAVPPRPAEAPGTEKPGDKNDGGVKLPPPARPEPTPTVPPRPAQTPAAKPADVKKTDASPPGTTAARQSTPPIQLPPALGSAAGQPAPSSPPADPSASLDLNDPVRQGLSAIHYIDASGSAVPVYHFTSIPPAGSGTAASKQHFCTISEQEKYKLIDSQSKLWKYEGIAFFAYAEGQQPPGSRPVHRFWSQSLNRYFFTMDEAQKQLLIDKLANVWKYEGVAWYAPPIKASPKK
jgi:hypothetical protein